VYCDGEIKDIAVISRVGKPVCFKVVSIDTQNGEPVIRLSRREAQRECTEGFISGLRAGDIIPSVVTHLDPFGAFVDIGIKQNGLVHASQMGVKGMADPSKVVKLHQHVKVMVVSVDLDRGRIGLRLL
jgi:small subunit ribosomal protein S1